MEKLLKNTPPPSITAVAKAAGGRSQPWLSNILLARRRPKYNGAVDLELVTGISRDLWLGGSKKMLRKAFGLIGSDKEKEIANLTLINNYNHFILKCKEKVKKG